MRRTQSLAIFLMVLVMAATATAAGPQLTAVSVNTEDNTTIITIRASSPFTHTEYRPADNLLLVDLPGVSAGVLDGQSQSVQGPGVAAYRVQSFKGTSGTEVARVELTLASTPFVTFNQDKSSLEVRVTASPSQALAPATAPATAAAPATPVAPAPPASQAVPVESTNETVNVTAHAPARVSGSALVRSLNVAQGPQGLEVNIHSNSPLKPVVQRAQNPERLVIDLENARTLRPVLVPVKSDDVKDVRMAMHQANPPVTRVVLDLDSPKDYELVASDTGLRVKLHAPAQVASLGAPPVAPAAPQAVIPAVAVMDAAAPTTTAAPAASAEVSNPTLAPSLAPAETSHSAPVTPPAPPEIAKPVPQPASVAPPEPAYPSPAPAPAPPQLAKPVPVPAPAALPEVSKAAAAPKPIAPSQSSNPTPTPMVSAAVPNPAPKPAVPLPESNLVPTATPAPSVQASKAAQDYVVVQPQFKPKPEPDPSTRAADAASKFSSGKTELALASIPALPGGNAALQPSAPANAAMPQQTPPPQPAPATKPKYTGEPISVNLKDVDLKDFFRLIHEISGLNVVLDPSVHGTLTLVLDDVPWDQALDIVLKNNGLERQLDGNVLRIATVDTLKREAEGRRAQVEAQALASPRVPVTRFLSYAHSKDLVPILKKFLSKRGEVVSDDRNNALIIMDIPEVFPEIDRLLTQLDRKTPEVEIEARVVAATRNFARDIGTQFGFAWTNSKAALGGTPVVGNSPIATTPPTFIGSNSSGGGAGQTIPLFSNVPATGPNSGIAFNLVGSNTRLDFILTAAEKRGLLKVLSRPRVITQNNIQAVVRQGLRIPVVTQAQLNGPPTTTYIDAFLRLTVTPQITVENTIFLNVDVENTTPDFSQQVQGNPTLHTQQALTQVLVTDGGTVVIGGVIATQNSVEIDQTPLLGSIPVVGNLFKRRFVQTETQELFFFITPKIVQT